MLFGLTLCWVHFVLGRQGVQLEQGEFGLMQWVILGKSVAGRGASVGACYPSWWRALPRAVALLAFSVSMSHPTG